MTEKEAADALRAEIQEMKLHCFEYLSMLTSMSPEELATCGYRNHTPAEAMRKAFNRTKDDIERKIRKFEKDFPG